LVESVVTDSDDDGKGATSWSYEGRKRSSIGRRKENVSAGYSWLAEKYKEDFKI
jgi:hypothetical protein